MGELEKGVDLFEKLTSLGRDGTGMETEVVAGAGEPVSIKNKLWAQLGVRLTVNTVAAAGSSAATAADAVVGFNNVTGADGTKGVVLPADAEAGDVVWIMNNDASSALEVFPASGDAVNPASADAAITVAADTMVLLVFIGSDTWVGSELPIIAA